ncbi:uncharacterized protein LOC110157731 isoform X3 [Boleophthalmus pectinirostris]|uniref:uncharacterized protein LOC110157731 isoform X3 n=1 Tax=Boleophthalmus pectinirostris TaxID=150288 RepID=UPI00242CB5BC|nr:uncharacterized protein LOC110157731 isoform X3 [Boleophthalmus pectinirostris]
MLLDTSSAATDGDSDSTTENSDTTMEETGTVQLSMTSLYVTDTMPVDRLRLRPWLEEQINSCEIPGLKWVNKEERIFQIPWLHGSHQHWDLEKDTLLFMRWAIHTGKYHPGEERPNPRVWKSNFRCALNSLPDIVEVKNKTIKRGSNAFRVYKMLSFDRRLNKGEEKKSQQFKGALCNFLLVGSSSACFYGYVIALPGMFHSMTLNSSALYLFNYKRFYSSKIKRQTSILTVSSLSTDLSCNLIWFGLHKEMFNTVHPSIFFRLSGAGSWGQQSKQGL